MSNMVLRDASTSKNSWVDHQLFRLSTIASNDIRENFALRKGKTTCSRKLIAAVCCFYITLVGVESVDITVFATATNTVI